MNIENKLYLNLQQRNGIDDVCDVSNIQYNQLVLSMLQEKKCIQIPTKAVSDFVKLLENENISFSFVKNEKSPHLTTIHQLYCNCEKKCNYLQNGYCPNGHFNQTQDQDGRFVCTDCGFYFN